MYCGEFSDFCGLALLNNFFLFEQKTAYEMRISDWSSDVCSSDLSADDGRNDFRNHFGRRAARLFNDGEEDAVALVVLTFNELIAGQASGAQESFKRLSR